MVSFEKTAVCLQNIEWSFTGSFLLLRGIALYAYVPLLEGDIIFQRCCSVVKAMLTQLATSKIYCGSSVEALCHRVITVLDYSLV